MGGHKSSDPGNDATAGLGEWLADGAGLDQGSDAAWVFADAESCRRALASKIPGFDTVYTLEHHVPISESETVYVTEWFTLSSWLCRPRRAVLLLTGSAYRGNSWSISAEGYNGTELLARNGFFVFTVDYLGVGQSSRPTAGLAATIEANLNAMKTVVKFIRFFREVPKIDVMGEGYGGILAVRLAEDAKQIRACVMTAMLYKELVAGPVKSPELLAALKNSPDGYFATTEESYTPFLSGAPEAVKQFIYSTQPGIYPTPNVLIAAGSLPMFDPSVARVPGIILFGSADFVVGPQDPYLLAADYGLTGSKLLIREGAGHAPRTESPECAKWFWDEVLNFLVR